MINKVIKIAKKAGEEILKVYDEDFSVVSKDDNSPLTKADLLADEIIKSSRNHSAPNHNRNISFTI